MAWLRATEGMMAGLKEAGVPVLSNEEAGVPPLPGEGRDMTASAWNVRITEEALRAHSESWGYWPAAISEWIVNGPFHPFWSWWYVACVHLRPIEGAPKPHLRYPEAGYEFCIRSLNPEPDDGRPETPDIDLLEAGDPVRGLPGFLIPADVVVQFHGVTDEQARDITELAVRHIVDGRASPDSDFARWWESSIQKTVEHVRAGLHG